jgi:hypothetical protein
LTKIKVGMIWPSNCLATTNQGDPTMASDIIEIWAAMLGLAYLAAAGLYFEMLSVRKLSSVPANCGVARHTRPNPVKISRSR